jgi:hypothetical protein
VASAEIEFPKPLRVVHDLQFNLYLLQKWLKKAHGARQNALNEKRGRFDPHYRKFKICKGGVIENVSYGWQAAEREHIYDDVQPCGLSHRVNPSLSRMNGMLPLIFADRQSANRPLPGGPFKGFLATLHGMQGEFQPERSLIRTALVMARGVPAHEQAICTLRVWRIQINEALFLGGLEKGRFSETFEADLFIDDQQRHCESARQHVSTGHVPHGVANTSI